MPATLTLHDNLDALPCRDALYVVGRRSRLEAADVRAWLPDALSDVQLDALLGRGDPGHDGRAQGTWLDDDPATRLVVGVLPEACSRHNAPSRAWAVPKVVPGLGSRKRASVVLALDDDDHAVATVAALARSLPTFDASSKTRDGTIDVVVLGSAGTPVSAAPLQVVADAVRQAAAWVDMPPNILDVDAMVAAARDLAASAPSVEIEVIQGEALRDGGFGGLWGVGKAATCGPALVVLDHVPTDPEGHDAWVGKGIVYDTGGLSLKTKTGMPGMKSDMGGAAAVLAAFGAAVRLGTARRITAVLCLAENAIGPAATRPDDILTMYSGRTVEVNNTDAEGRLVLADGVAWVVAERAPQRLFDLATLTGAQAIATGKKHAAIVSDDDDLETATVLAGRATGDLVHPLPFSPELLVREFRSSVADLKNSVKDRANAQSSCAAEFIRQHLPDDAPPWLHIDLAAPAVSGGRGTGYGVALLLRLAEAV